METAQTDITSGPLTARDLLGIDPDALAATLGELIGDEEAGSASAPDAPRPAPRVVVGQAVKALEQVLQELELGRLLLAGWSQLDELAALKEETRADGSTKSLCVASHTITSEHAPSLDLEVNQVRKKLLDLAIALDFDIEACDLVVESGQIADLELGSLRARGVVQAKGRTVAERESSELDLARLFPRRPVETLSSS